MGVNLINFMPDSQMCNLINHFLFNYYLAGSLISDFARLGPPVGSDIDTNGALNVSSTVGGKKKKKKRRHRY